MFFVLPLPDRTLSGGTMVQTPCHVEEEGVSLSGRARIRKERGEQDCGVPSDLLWDAAASGPFLCLPLLRASSYSFRIAASAEQIDEFAKIGHGS